MRMRKLRSLLHCKGKAVRQVLAASGGTYVWPANRSRFCQTAFTVGQIQLAHTAHAGSDVGPGANCLA